MHEVILKRILKLLTLVWLTWLNYDETWWNMIKASFEIIDIVLFKYVSNLNKFKIQICIIR